MSQYCLPAHLKAPDVSSVTSKTDSKTAAEIEEEVHVTTREERGTTHPYQHPRHRKYPLIAEIPAIRLFLRP